MEQLKVFAINKRKGWESNPPEVIRLPPSRLWRPGPPPDDIRFRKDYTTKRDQMQYY